jgi:hypothetical protein
MTSIVLGGMALAAYFSASRMTCSSDVETHRYAHQAPDNWLEALYLFSEALRYDKRQVCRLSHPHGLKRSDCRARTSEPGRAHFVGTHSRRRSESGAPETCF